MLHFIFRTYNHYYFIRVFLFLPPAVKSEVRTVMTPLTNIPFQYISPSSPSHFSFSLQGHFRCYIRRLGRTHDIYPSFAHLHRQLFFLIFHILLLPIICSIIVSSTSSCFISSLWLFSLLKLHERSSLYKAKM